MWSCICCRRVWRLVFLRTAPLLDSCLVRNYSFPFFCCRSHIHPKESTEGSCVLEGMVK